ncbi:MAG: hypothetical protein L0K86_23775 [Actinomycetia bacterium]|nr:hypothetical protein [Actinomycetes bacterium]
MNLRTSSALARMAAQSFPSADLLPRNDLREQALQLLAQVDPAAPRPDAVLQRPAVLTRRRVLLVAGIGVAAVWGSVSVPGLVGPTAYAATAPLLHYTPLDAKETPTNVLDGLAALARRQPSPPGSGPFN